MRRRHLDAEYEYSFFDDFPEELRAAVNKYRCSTFQVAQLLARGTPVNVIIAALEREQPNA